MTNKEQSPISHPPQISDRVLEETKNDVVEGQSGALDGEVLPITESAVPEDRIVGVLANLADNNSRALGSSAVAKLSVAAFKQIEDENTKLDSTNTSLQETLDELKDENAGLRTDLAVAKQKISSNRKIGIFANILLLVAPILVGVALSLPAESGNTPKMVLVVLAAVCALGGFVVQLRFGDQG